MKLPIKILVHVIFWMVFLLFTIAFSRLGQFPEQWPSLDDVNVPVLINTTWAMTIFYWFYFYIYRFFELGKFVRYFVLSVLSAIGVTVVFMPLFALIIPGISVQNFNFKLVIPPLTGSFILAQCGCLVRGFENWFDTVKLKMDLENKNLRNELELLKSQINPHFLFNSLNNIDMLIRKSPDNASKSLITLSDMLRYMIYETGGDQVPLYKEIDYLRNFISLQRLRFKKEEYINAEFPADCSGRQVAPMLFVPFVENAFKHSGFTGVFPVIEISLQCTGSEITFVCTNYFPPEGKPDGRPGGVGLGNVKRRLELLYPGKHVLSIEKENGKFIVELKIAG